MSPGCLLQPPIGRLQLPAPMASTWAPQELNLS
jgi:hypothetical protein